MTPDRELTEEEIRRFVNEASEGKLGFEALVAFLEEKTKPTLHDLCISELYAVAEAMRQIIIQQGREVEVLKERLKEVKQ